MKAQEFITEDSTLSALGVPRKTISNIHNSLKLKHNTKFKPIKNKTEAKKAISRDRVIIAVNAEGEAYGIGHWAHPQSGGEDVMMGNATTNNWGSVSSLTKALAKIKGRGFNYYVSVKRNQHQAKYQRDRGYNYGEPFVDKVRATFDSVIKSDAAKAANVVKHHLIDVMDDTITDPDPHLRTRGYTPSQYDLNAIKSTLKILKNIAENGLSGYRNSWDQSGSRAAMKDFFSTSYDYMLDSAVSDFEENEKLAVHKFVKFVRKEIANIVERATTGGFKEHGKRAGDYKDADDLEAADAVVEGHYALPKIDRERYTDIPGLEGPFVYKSGKVLYYDPKEGRYYDRDTDMYLSHDEFQAHDDGGTPRGFKEEEEPDSLITKFDPNSRNKGRPSFEPATTTCPNCNGTGWTDVRGTECSDCGGTGEIFESFERRLLTKLKF
jgi:hypothetical protein